MGDFGVNLFFLLSLPIVCVVVRGGVLRQGARRRKRAGCEMQREGASERGVGGGRAVAGRAKAAAAAHLAPALPLTSIRTSSPAFTLLR